LSTEGDLLWRYETGGWVDSSPVLDDDGVLYVGSGDQNVYAIDTGAEGPDDSPWPMFGADRKGTSRQVSSRRRD